MALREEECVITDEALDTIVDIFEGTSGIRDLEQAAEHIALVRRSAGNHQIRMRYIRPLLNLHTAAFSRNTKNINSFNGFSQFFFIIIDQYNIVLFR